MARKKAKDYTWLTQLLKIAVIALFVIFVGVVSVNQAMSFFEEGEMFKVKRIVLEPELQFISKTNFAGVQGRSIFEVDINAMQKKLQARYPEIHHLRVMRRFPDEIDVKARKREPLAFLSLGGKEVLLDKYGTVMGLEGDGRKDLPLITGINPGRPVLLGRRYQDRDLDLALTIIREFDRREDLDPYRLVSLNISSRSQIEMFLDNQLKIILDHDKIPQKIQTLGLMLSQGDLDVKEYIDLRFKNPVSR